jgi:simple sugar transport system permease protein
MEKIKNSIKNMDNSIKTLWLMVIIVLVIMLILDAANFFTFQNLRSMVFQFPEFGIMAFGMMICMISGGIDLSLVGIANLSGIICVEIVLNLNGSIGFVPSAVLGYAAALAVGALCGLFNGFMIGYLKIPAMLVTLCGLELFKGLGEAITTGPALTGLPDAYKLLGNGDFFSIPFVIIPFLIVVIAVSFIMRSTVYGQQVYFMGTNNEAARYSGINCFKTTELTYMISGILGGVCGIIITSHFNSAKSDYGTSYTLLTLLIVVLGGLNPDGGKGKVSGVLLAIILLQLISNAFSILQLDSSLKQLVYGALLIGSLLVNIMRERVALKRETRLAAAKE